MILAHSDDRGVNWQGFKVGAELASPESAVLNDDNDRRKATGVAADVTAGQVFARLSADAQGNVGVIWYDTRRDPADHLLDVFGAISTDGGQSFSPNFRITNVSFDADQGRFTNALGNDEFSIGDFIGLAMADNTAYAAWTDTRNGDQDIFFARYSVDPSPSALNDRFEPNDAPEQTASPTNLGTVIKRHLPKLAIEAGDEDWFLLQTAATGELTVSASQAAPGDSLRLELWNKEATVLLGTGVNLLDGDGHVIGERLDLPSRPGQEFLVHVLPTPGSEAAQYELEVQSLTADLGTRVHGVVAGSLAPGDVAYYLLAAGAPGSLEVTFTSGTGVQGNLNLELLELDELLHPDDLKVLAVGQPSGGPGAGETEHASLAVRESQLVLLRVSGETAAQGDFTLEFTNLDQFTSPAPETFFFPAGARPSQSALADLDGDTHLDLVVSNAMSDTVSVLAGSGDGAFQAPRQFVVGAFVEPPGYLTTLLPTFGRDVTIADFNQDGIPDAAITNQGSSDVSVLLGRGDGTFEPQRRFDATFAPFALEAGDLNGDDRLDLAVVSSSTSQHSSTPQQSFLVSTLLGRGDGTFRPQRTIEVPAGGEVFPGAIQIAELNGDGVADLVVSASSNFELAVLFGSIDENGDVIYAMPDPFPAGRLGVGLVVADINADGNPDILNTGFDHANQVAVLLGNGDGTFEARQDFFAGQNPVALQVADFGRQFELPDGSTVLGPPDGRLDVVVAVSGKLVSAVQTEGPPGVVVLPALFDDQGGFLGLGEPIQLAEAEAAQDVDVGDVNHDGALDIVAVVEGGVLVIFGQPPRITPNDTPDTARDLGVVVHHVDQTQTIVPGHEDSYYTLKVPTEAVAGTDEQIIDFSGLFQHEEGAGLGMEVVDSQGNVLAFGERFRLQAAQGEVLLLHVFGDDNGDGTRGSGAYTLVIDVLPQVVSVEAAALLPGVGDAPGGPTTSIVLTLQGDRLDPVTAQDRANYVVTWLGPDGQLGGGDDQVRPLSTGAQAVVYAPSANRDITTGITHPTAVRQTITLLFDNPLPAGSYQIEILPAVQTQDFNDTEDSLLAGGAGLQGHPLVQAGDPMLSGGAVIEARDLVFASGALGDFAAFEQGTAFLAQLHDDLSAILDDILTNRGDDPNISDHINAHIRDRVSASLAGASGTFGIVVLWLDPTSIEIVDPDGNAIIGPEDFNNDIPAAYVDLIGNVELIVIAAEVDDIFDLTVANVPDLARGGYVVFDGDQVTDQTLTDELRDDETEFEINI